MASVLILGTTGSGKSTSIFPNEKIGIKGLNPKETFLITATTKAVPMKNWKEHYTLTRNPKEGNYMKLNDIELVGKALDIIKTRDDIKNVVIDDNQYLMGDYYMLNSENGDGYTVFKKIGLFMAKIISGVDACVNAGKNVFIMSHYEVIETKRGTMYKPKTAGKMVDNYLTLEGKFDLVLYARTNYDPVKKSMVREFVTNADGEYNEARSLPGLFDEVHIPNDLAIVEEKMKEYGI
jgi:hypothetical protein